MASRLLELPGETRDQIYHYALDMDDPQVVAWPSFSEPATQKPSSRMSLLLTCKEIYLEAAGLFRTTSAAHVRVAPERVDVQGCLECIGASRKLPPKSNHGSPCPNRATAHHGLSRFMKVNIFLPSDFAFAGEIRELCLERLLDALTTFTNSSADICKGSNLRRQVCIHMTETIDPTQWLPEKLPLSEAAMDMMKKDAHTDWQFHYHIYPCI